MKYMHVRRLFILIFICIYLWNICWSLKNISWYNMPARPVWFFSHIPFCLFLVLFFFLGVCKVISEATSVTPWKVFTNLASCLFIHERKLRNPKMSFAFNLQDHSTTCTNQEKTHSWFHLKSYLNPFTALTGKDENIWQNASGVHNL